MLLCEKCGSRQVRITRQGSFCRSCGFKKEVVERCGDCGKIIKETKSKPLLKLSSCGRRDEERQKIREANKKIMAENRANKPKLNTRLYCTGIHIKKSKDGVLVEW